MFWLNFYETCGNKIVHLFILSDKFQFSRPLSFWRCSDSPAAIGSTHQRPDIVKGSSGLFTIRRWKSFEVQEVKRKNFIWERWRAEVVQSFWVEVKRWDPGGWRGAAVSGRVVFGMIRPFCKEEREKQVSPFSALTVTFPEALRPMPFSTLLVEVDEIIVPLRLAARFLVCFCHPALEPCASRLSTTLL